MTVLIFKHEGWDVVTASWSVAAPNASADVTLCYAWPAKDLGMCPTTLPFNMATFLQAISAGGTVDLRPLQSGLH